VAGPEFAEDFLQAGAAVAGAGFQAEGAGGGDGEFACFVARADIEHGRGGEFAPPADAGAAAEGDAFGGVADFGRDGDVGNDFAIRVGGEDDAAMDESHASIVEEFAALVFCVTPIFPSCPAPRDADRTDGPSFAGC